MHIGGTGPVETMSVKIRAILDQVKLSRGHNPSEATVQPVINAIDTARLNTILGHRGEMNKGVYKYTIGRPDVKLMEHGAAIGVLAGQNNSHKG